MIAHALADAAVCMIQAAFYRHRKKVRNAKKKREKDGKVSSNRTWAVTAFWFDRNIPLASTGWSAKTPVVGRGHSKRINTPGATTVVQTQRRSPPNTGGAGEAVTLL